MTRTVDLIAVYGPSYGRPLCLAVYGDNGKLIASARADDDRGALERFVSTIDSATSPGLEVRLSKSLDQSDADAVPAIKAGFRDLQQRGTRIGTVGKIGTYFFEGWRDGIFDIRFG